MQGVAEALYFQETDKGLFVLAQGHITAAVSADLRELVLGRLTRAPVPPLLAVDLSSCEYMDSTFMGLLVGFHKRYKSLTGRPLTIVRPTGDCKKLLAGLGILRLLSLAEGAEPEVPTTWQTIHPVQAPTPEVVLTAHQNLSEISPENEKKFAALQAVLAKDLENKSR